MFEVRNYLFLMSFFYVLTFPFLSKAQDIVHITRQVHYGSDTAEAVDIYQTEYCKKNRCPVVMWVHGGGWKHGDTSGECSTEMQSLWAQQGIVMVGVNYRLTPHVMHPDHVMDVAASIDWVYKHISEYGGDPGRISLLGHSAGAHLVALVATNPRFLNKFGYDPIDIIKNVFPIDTASFDLTDHSSRFVTRLVKDAFGTDPEVLRDASPILQVHNGGKYPPFLMAAVKVRQDAVSNSQILQSKLRSAGGSAELMIVDYGKINQLKAHGMIAKSLADLDSQMTKALLARVLSE